MVAAVPVVGQGRRQSKDCVPGFYAPEATGAVTKAVSILGRPKQPDWVTGSAASHSLFSSIFELFLRALSAVSGLR